jgi:hypothetical protein
MHNESEMSLKAEYEYCLQRMGFQALNIIEIKNGNFNVILTNLPFDDQLNYRTMSAIQELISENSQGFLFELEFDSTYFDDHYYIIFSPLGDYNQSSLITLYERAITYSRKVYYDMLNVISSDSNNSIISVDENLIDVICDIYIKIYILNLKH